MITPVQEGIDGITFNSPVRSNPPLTPISPYSISMAPGETVRERALIMQDILSSFDAEALPCEICPTIFNNIVYNSDSAPGMRPDSSEWTIQNDLQGTLLLRAAYDENFFKAIFNLQLPTNRAVHFREKIEKRFETCIAQYDRLIESPPSNTSEFKSAMMAIAQSFRHLSSILYKDGELQRRQTMDQTADAETVTGIESKTAQILLTILERICERDQAISLAGRNTRSTSTNDSNLTLFRQLIGAAGPKGELFLLASLERFARDALNANMEKMILVENMLEELHAPREYLEKYKSIRDPVSYPAQQSAPGGPSGHESGLKADPNRRGKRTQEEPQELPPTPKRSRRTDRT